MCFNHAHKINRFNCESIEEKQGQSVPATKTMQERLQKIIARAGIASRRHAEQLIVSGQVRVNGHVITELGSKADPAADRIEAAGKVITAE